MNLTDLNIPEPKRKQVDYILFNTILKIYPETQG